MKYIFSLICFAILILTFVKCEIGPNPPMFPWYYSVKWNIYFLDKNTPPPINISVDPQNYVKEGSGESYYDYQSNSFLDIYHDYCLPILGDEFNFKCKFLNVHNIFYAIKNYDLENEECCIFARDFPVFTPNSLIKSSALYQGKFNFGKPGVQTEHYFVESQPAGYGFYTNKTVKGFNVFAYFINYPYVEGGWYTQKNYNIEDFKVERPLQKLFQIPTKCLAADVKKCFE
jgi:hypothetical protein